MKARIVGLCVLVALAVAAAASFGLEIGRAHV